MERKVVSTTMLTMFLVSTLYVAFDVSVVVAYGIIHIKADGSVDPPTAPIQRIGNLYKFTSDIYDLISVERSGIVLDGSGYTLQGPEVGWDAGVALDVVDGVIVTNMNIRGWWVGVHWDRSGLCRVFGNNLTENGLAIDIVNGSYNNTICENNITDNFDYVVAVSDGFGTNIFENNITDNRGGSLEPSIIVCGGSYNRISGNNLVNNDCAVKLENTANNTVSGNNIADNSYGIWLCGALENTIFENSVVNNTNYGVGLEGAESNNIYHNDFKDNTPQVYRDDPYDRSNIWDRGYPSGGNYWSDYVGVDEKTGPNQDQPKGDGIGDTPYVISENNRDGYPIALIDSDGDGLNNIVELNGVDFDHDGTIDLTPLDANPMHKDLYIEIDYMSSGGTHDHEPDADAIRNVTEAFSNAPVSNPDNENGITLHIEVDGEIPHQDSITAWDDFDSLKNQSFGTLAQRTHENSINILGAKSLFYRYCLFIHQFALWNGTHWRTTDFSGIAELAGNDFMVSLGAWPDHRGTRDEQAGTLMHELGHTLGLRHGGGDDINGKPNYLSIMSYSRQFSDFIPDRPLDYSRQKLPTLNENALNETVGIGGPLGDRTIHGPLFFNIASGRWEGFRAPSHGATDWNRNGTIEGNVEMNTNDFRPVFRGPQDDALGALEGHDDWGNLVCNFLSSPDSADGVHLNVADQEISWETVEKMRNTTLIGFHDIMVTNVATVKTVVSQGYSVNISATVANQGDYIEETLNITFYANTTSVATHTITLASGDSTNLTFTWNTADFVKGNYTLCVYAWPVQGETDTTDNTYVYGYVRVAMPGDIAADYGIVDIFDIAKVALHFNHEPPDGHLPETPECTACFNADIQEDRLIDIFDIVVVASHFGHIDP